MNVAGFFTKPLVGGHFKEFRKFLMGAEPEKPGLFWTMSRRQQRPIVSNPVWVYYPPVV